MASFSILAIAGTVSSRVLSSGPVLLVFSSFVVSSLGTLKPPGSSLFVAVLSRRPARKKEAMSAAPARIMIRLNAQEMTFFAREWLTLNFFMTWRIVTPKVLLAGSTLYGQVLPDAPLVPRAVVVGESPVTEPVQGEERDRGRDPAVAVGDDGLVSILGHARLPQPPLQFLVGAEGAALGLKEAIGVEVRSPWYVPRSGRLARHGTGVLTLVARIENEGAAPAEERFGFRPPTGSWLGCEDGRFGFRDLDGSRTALGCPLVPAAVEDKDLVVRIVGQGPPQTGGELSPRVIVNHHPGVVTDTKGTHRPGEASWRGDLCGHGVVGVGYVAGPVHVDGAGDMGLIVLPAGREVLRLLAYNAKVSLLYVTPDVYDAQVFVFETGGEPVGRDEGVPVLHATPPGCRVH